MMNRAKLVYLCLFLGFPAMGKEKPKSWSFKPFLSVSHETIGESGLEPDYKKPKEYRTYKNSPEYTFGLDSSFTYGNTKFFALFKDKKSLGDLFLGSILNDKSTKTSLTSGSFNFISEGRFLNFGFRTGRFKLEDKFSEKHFTSIITPQNKIDQIFFAPFLQLKYAYGDILFKLPLKQEIHSDIEKNSQNFSLSENLLSWSFLYSYNFQKLAQVNLEYAKQKVIANQDKLNYESNIYTINLEKDLKRNLFIKFTLKHQLKNKKYEKQQINSLQFFLQFNRTKKHSFVLSTLLKKSIHSNDNLSDQFLTTFFISYTFNFLENNYTGNRKNFPLYELIEFLA